MLACWGSSLHTLSHKTAVPSLSLSNRWPLIRPDPVRRRKGRMCSVALVAGVDAANPLPARPDLRYPSFSPTKLRCGRAFDPCSLPQQIPPTAAHPTYILTTLRDISISPRCYCDLLVNCTKHFFIKSVLGSSTKMSHWQHFYISMVLHKGSLDFLSSSSNSQPNLLEQVVSLKRDCKGDTQLYFLVELHKMIGMVHASDSLPTCRVDFEFLAELWESSCQRMNIVARK